MACAPTPPALLPIALADVCAHQRRKPTASLLPQASRRALEAATGAPVPMARFRPNIVVDGGDLAPYDEDAWTAVRTGRAHGAAGGALRLSLVKPCSRCAVTCVDQETAQSGAEPLRSLARTRSGALLAERQGVFEAHPEWARQSFFSWNAVLEGPGTLCEGGSIECEAR